MIRSITLILLAITGSLAYTTPSNKPVRKLSINRATFLTTTASTCLTFLVGASTSASAKEVDPSVKGTKSDPTFQACLGKCVYECTKPKGNEQKSRAECLPECKKKCATDDKQLLLGSPKWSIVSVWLFFQVKTMHWIKGGIHHSQYLRNHNVKYDIMLLVTGVAKRLCRWYILFNCKIKGKSNTTTCYIDCYSYSLMYWINVW